MNGTSIGVGWGRILETRRFRRDSSAPARVRDLVSRHAGPGRESEGAILAASEIATNAVRHGDPGVPDLLEARIFHDGSALTVEVTGRGSFVAAGQDGGGEAGVGGFGLAVVDSVASQWGIEQSGPRLRVWFTVEGVSPRQQRIRR